MFFISAIARLMYRELFSINPLIDPLLTSRRLQCVFFSPGIEERNASKYDENAPYFLLILRE